MSSWIETSRQQHWVTSGRDKKKKKKEQEEEEEEEEWEGGK